MLPGGTGFVERLVKRLDPIDLPATRGDDQVAALQTGAGRGAVVLDRADQDSVALGQADGAAQPACDPRRGNRNPETDALGRLAASKRLDPLAERRVGSDREDQPPIDPDRVDAEQPARGVDQRAARRASRQRRRVLDRAPDATAAWTPEAASGGRHKPRRHAQAATAGVGQRHDRATDLDRLEVVVGPVDRLGLAGVDLDHREVEISVRARDPPGLAPPVGERDGHLAVAQVVRVGQHPARSRSRRPNRRPSRAQGPTTAGPVCCAVF